MLTLTRPLARSHPPRVGKPRLRDVSTRIFNHDVRGCTAGRVVGDHLYSSRALGITEPDDIIQLHPDLKSEWSIICAHYDRIGLSVTDRVIWNVDPHELSDHPERKVSVFYFGATEQEARPNSPWYRVVEHINSKNNFITLAKELGVPVPATRCYADVAEIDETAIRQIAFPCYLKAAVSLSGVDIYRCASQRDLRAARSYFRSGVPVQVQSEISSDYFLNLQYEVKCNGLSHLAVTEQVLEGPVHQGNRYPARSAPWDCVEPMAQWLYEKGIEGVLAFDVAVIDRPGYRNNLAIECNPRFNAASYPTAIAKKLGIGHWLARNFKTEYRTLADIDLAGLEYDPFTGEGIVLVNWGTILVGRLTFLIAGPVQVQERLALELHKGL